MQGVRASEAQYLGYSSILLSDHSKLVSKCCIVIEQG